MDGVAADSVCRARAGSERAGVGADSAHLVAGRWLRRGRAESHAHAGDSAGNVDLRLTTLGAARAAEHGGDVRVRRWGDSGGIARGSRGVRGFLLGPEPLARRGRREWAERAVRGGSYKRGEESGAEVIP